MKTYAEFRTLQEPGVDGTRLGDGDRGESGSENFTTIGALGDTPIAPVAGVVLTTAKGSGACATKPKVRACAAICDAQADVTGISAIIEIAEIA